MIKIITVLLLGYVRPPVLMRMAAGFIINKYMSSFLVVIIPQ